MVKYIRGNVLQIPKRISLKFVDDSSNSQSLFSTDNVKIKKRTIITDKFITSTKHFGSLQQVKMDNRYRLSIDNERKPPRHESKNFIAKNIENAAKTKKIEYYSDDDNCDANKQKRRLSTSSEGTRKSWSIEPKVAIINYNVNPTNVKEGSQNDSDSRVR